MLLPTSSKAEDFPVSPTRSSVQCALFLIIPCLRVVTSLEDTVRTHVGDVRETYLMVGVLPLPFSSLCASSSSAEVSLYRSGESLGGKADWIDMSGWGSAGAVAL